MTEKGLPKERFYTMQIMAWVESELKLITQVPEKK